MSGSNQRIRHGAKKVTQSKVTRFAALGLINTGLDFILFNALRVATDTVSDQTLRLIALNLVSASCVALFSFFMNRRFVYKNPVRRRRFIIFLAITLTSIFILQSTVIALSVPLITPFGTWLFEFMQDLSIPVISNFSVHFYISNIAKVLATLASMIWNYKLYDRYVFKK